MTLAGPNLGLHSGDGVEWGSSSGMRLKVKTEEDAEQCCLYVTVNMLVDFMKLLVSGTLPVS